MMNLVSRLAMIMLLGILPYIQAEEAQEDKKGIVFHATETDWKDAPSYPGAKVAIIEGKPAEAAPFTIRYKFPANTTILPHFHPGEERDTVISGSLHVMMGEDLSTQTPQTLLPGDFWFIPAKYPHAAYTTEETVLQIQGMGPWGITYLPCLNCT